MERTFEPMALDEYVTKLENALFELKGRAERSETRARKAERTLRGALMALDRGNCAALEAILMEALKEARAL